MTDANRQRIYDALLGEIPEDLARVLESIATVDVESIEPIIDDIEQQAACRARFAMLLELCYQSKSSEGEREEICRTL
jgi:hypothetical protein